jgi:hypothetical protein
MLTCYPAEFRAEFGPEMYAVFYTKLCEAQRKGMITVWELLWRELRGWPGSVLKEHLRERINKMGTQVRYTGSKPLSGIDWLAASVLFILPLIGSVIPRIANGYDLPHWTGYILLSIFLGSVIFALVLAVFRGLPRWSLSYFGFFLTILTFYAIGLGLWGLLVVPPWMLIFGPRDSWSLPVNLLYNGLMVAFTWLLVLLVAIVVINLLRNWPRVDALWQHIREDWTHLSFLLYGGSVFYIWLIFDEYRYEDSWISGAFVCLAIGAWFYLRAKGQNMRILALISGVTAALWVVTVGKWILVPMQDWPVNIESERIFEPLRTIGSWIVTLVALLAPALLKLLPSSPSSTIEEGITTT